MYKVWAADADGAEELARQLEAHLNEFAEAIVSVSYAIADRHYALAVYRMIDVAGTAAEEAAMERAEIILDDAQS